MLYTRRRTGVIGNDPCPRHTHPGRSEPGRQEGQEDGGRTRTEPSGHVSQPCPQEQDPADDLSGQRRRNSRGRGDLVQTKTPKPLKIKSY